MRFSNHERTRDKDTRPENVETGLTLTAKEWADRSCSVAALENFLIEHRLAEGKSYVIQVDGMKQLLNIDDRLVTVYDQSGRVLWESTKRADLAQLM